MSPYSGDPDTNAAFDAVVAEEHPGDALHCTRRDGLVTLADVIPERVSWLWPGRVPLGKLVVLDGDPSVGKSTLAVDVAARVTTRGEMPDGTCGDLDGPADVIYLSAEDGIADTIRPRAEAASADLTRLHVLTEVELFGDDGQVVGIHPPSIPADLPEIERHVVATGARLVVVDVLSAFLSGKVDSYRDQDVRGALAPLAAMAERTGCTVLVIRHLSKSGGTHALYRGGGSIGIVGAARAALMVGIDPDDPERRIIACTKSNLGPMPEAMAYRLVPAEEHGCARVAWEGATSHTAADLLRLPEGEHERAESDDAATVLAGVLDGGDLWVGDAIDRMEEAGFSKDQAKRAKGKLGVRSVKVGAPGESESGWKWSLPRRERETPEGSEGSGTQSGAPFAPLGPDLHPSGSGAAPVGTDPYDDYVVSVAEGGGA